MSEAEARRNALAVVVGQRRLLLFVASRFFSGTGIALLRATISWQIYQLSGSAFHLGLAGLVQFLPALLLSLVGGAVADAWDRKRIVVCFQVVPAACSAYLALASRRGEVDLVVLYALIVVTAVAGAFESPARSALLPQLVERRDFTAAVTVHSAVQMLAFMSGPVLMGFAVARAGIYLPYALHFACMVISLACLAGVRALRDVTGSRRVSWAAIREGLSFVRQQPVVLGCMTLDMFAVLFGGATALLPIYATCLRRSRSAPC
jgi:MFS family permease